MATRVLDPWADACYAALSIELTDKSIFAKSCLQALLFSGVIALNLQSFCNSTENFTNLYFNIICIESNIIFLIKQTHSNAVTPKQTGLGN